MSSSPTLTPPARRRAVQILATGGTIAMRDGAGGQVLDGAPPGSLDRLGGACAGPPQTVMLKPSVHLTPADALELARLAIAHAEEGVGVVVAAGTDCMEELAFLCDLLSGAEAPIVFTGAMRLASAAGADGPANVRDAVVVAAHPAAAGLGAVVCFGGQIHAARYVRKVDSTGPLGFGSPLAGPLGFVDEDRLHLLGTVARRPPLLPEALGARVECAHIGLGSGGELVRLLAAAVDGLVAVLPGAGHVSPATLEALAAAQAKVPVVVVPRPIRGAILRQTYGFRGSERDVRGAGLICAGALSAAAARIKLLACLGANLDREEIRQAFQPDDL
ncbi:MAG: asparaginase [Actinobacteria bacterium]|nr:asparaginase [Actinomycetota bacterium]